MLLLRFKMRACRHFTRFIVSNQITIVSHYGHEQNINKYDAESLFNFMAPCMARLLLMENVNPVTKLNLAKNCVNSYRETRGFALE